MDKFNNLTPEEVSVLRLGLFILIDDYQRGVTDDENEYEIALRLRKELDRKYGNKE